ncbi:TPA: hypothetical protein L9851_005520 [Klebsiella pneumoniae]|uniref:hypothetical protein n=1 Tax=Klebsiella pneumoniae TaxID=573 RepID=UPI00143028ED|nr:hypothetical protein [Klebsiella pneumoniae]EKW8561435.1 hypothetical protein [Klebsiella pneumoniae]EMC2598201.1 hypothetical protein [Klebsiella pneumoniae]MBL9369848.1 hypothetical protein [Klebsiella pneumoniae]MBL9453554.1 hypothetical protein [Klebsiella pneumoniae]MBL9469952.1 hypothetical protein [Klebsiella pneumoniae]
MNNENGLTPSQLAERNAILVTEIEKCRELSGCPADVDLQDWVKMLVSELSVVEEIHNSAVFITDELYDASSKEVQGIIRSLACMKMPAYASLVAGIKADGVEEFAAHLRANYNGSSVCKIIALGADDFAKQLREGDGKCV